MPRSSFEPAQSDSALIFDGRDFQIFAEHRGSKGVIIAFSAFNDFQIVDRLFAREFAESLGLGWIFVKAKANHWWQHEGREELCAIVRSEAGRYPDSVAYGISMGGYGALTLGPSCGCKRIVAVAPQTVLNEPTAPLEPAMAACVARRPIISDDAPGALAGLVPTILYDPHYLPDARQVAWLSARAQIEEIRLPGAGHKVLKTLKVRGLLKRAMVRLLTARPLDDRFFKDYESVPPGPE